jgi:hypothetical protein
MILMTYCDHLTVGRTAVHLPHPGGPKLFYTSLFYRMFFQLSLQDLPLLLSAALLMGLSINFPALSS